MSKFTDRIDMRFKYTPAASTDIGATIRKEQRRLAEEKARQDAEAAALQNERDTKVRKIVK